MVTRSKVEIVKRRALLTYFISTKPISVKEALSSPLWKANMEEEYGALMRNKT